MKAKDLLKEIVKAYPDVVAIARDYNGNLYAYCIEIPVAGKLGEFIITISFGSI